MSPSYPIWAQWITSSVKSAQWNQLIEISSVKPAQWNQLNETVAGESAQWISSFVNQLCESVIVNLELRISMNQLSDSTKLINWVNQLSESTEKIHWENPLWKSTLKIHFENQLWKSAQWTVQWISLVNQLNESVQ